MTHRVIIIDDNSQIGSGEYHPAKPEVRVSIPVPDDATPKQVGDMVEKTLKALDLIAGVV